MMIKKCRSGRFRRHFFNALVCNPYPPITPRSIHHTHPSVHPSHHLSVHSSRVTKLRLQFSRTKRVNKRHNSCPPKCLFEAPILVKKLVNLFLARDAANSIETRLQKVQSILLTYHSTFHLLLVTYDSVHNGWFQ